MMGLEGAEDWAGATAAMLQELGFTLLNSDRPGSPAGAQLLVALRTRPTLSHFDPELIRCWVAKTGRGTSTIIDRESAARDRPILWGHVHVVDRLHVENRFLTFGGLMRVADFTPDLRVVQHLSPGPVVRWGGHSQGSDPLAGEIGAFFGRLIVSVDYVPGSEARLAVEPPEHLYAAFLRDAAARRQESVRRGTALAGWSGYRGDPLAPWLSAETTRVRDGQPGWWTAAGVLLDDIDLGPEGQATERAAAREGAP